jgi:hypothetical protein
MSSFECDYDRDNDNDRAVLDTSDPGIKILRANGDPGALVQKPEGKIAPMATIVPLSLCNNENRYAILQSIPHG